jgi:hypothetical protein
MESKELKLKIDTISNQFDGICKQLYKFIEEHKEYTSLMVFTKNGANEIPVGDNIDLFMELRVDLLQQSSK